MMKLAPSLLLLLLLAVVVVAQVTAGSAIKEWKKYQDGKIHIHKKTHHRSTKSLKNEESTRQKANENIMKINKGKILQYKKTAIKHTQAEDFPYSSRHNDLSSDERDGHEHYDNWMLDDFHLQDMGYREKQKNRHHKILGHNSRYKEVNHQAISKTRHQKMYNAGHSGERRGKATDDETLKTSSGATRRKKHDGMPGKQTSLHTTRIQLPKYANRSHYINQTNFQGNSKAKELMKEAHLKRKMPKNKVKKLKSEKKKYTKKFLI